MLDNIKLRKPLITDLGNHIKWENDSKNNDYTDLPVVYTTQQIEAFLRSDHDLFLQNQLRYIIELNSLSVGCIDLYDYDVVNSRAGVGIYVDRDFRNIGVASKSLDIIKTISRDFYHISNLYADIISKNTKSIKVFENANFKRNGLKENWIRTQNSFENVLFYQCCLIND